MATPQGVAQPSAKKRSFLLRDLFRLCRSISRVLPRDKHNHHQVDKANKHERKIHTNESRRNDQEPKPKNNHPKAFNFQEAKATTVNNNVDGVSLCKVRSYRSDNTNTNFVGSKKPSPISRSCSQNTATTAATTAAATNSTMRSLSFIGRSKSSSTRSTDSGVTPTLMRSTTSVPRSLTNPILYSSSSAKVAKPSPTEKKLSCTLEELCKGCTKKIKIKRDVITSSGQMSEEEEIVEIKVKPGWRGGTKVTFEGKGNEAMGSVPADLTFVIVEKEHEVFKREGDDLVMTVDVSLLEALIGFEFSVTLPDGDKMSLKIEDVIHPGYVTVVQGKGMPISKEKGKKRGDLRVGFRTKFPHQLTNDQRAEVQSILQDCS